MPGERVPGKLPGGARGLAFQVLGKPSGPGDLPRKPVNVVVKRARFSFEDGKR